MYFQLDHHFPYRSIWMRPDGLSAKLTIGTCNVDETAIDFKVKFMQGGEEENIHIIHSIMNVSALCRISVYVCEDEGV